MRLRIRYRSSTEEVTERIISDAVVEHPNKITAYCHLRGTERSFTLGQIEQAVDLETGELIPDIWIYFGLPSRKAPVPQMPVFPEQPQEMWTSEASNLRKADKYALFKRFRNSVIIDFYEARLWALFGNQCFKCGATTRLEYDHHIPQYLGGRLVPGNIVILCARCNLRKKDKHPDKFYSPQQLSRLKEVLQQQLELFDFKFDYSRWNRNPKDYLLSLGIPLADVEKALITDSPKQQHKEEPSIIIKIDTDEFIKQIQSMIDGIDPEKKD